MAKKKPQQTDKKDDAYQEHLKRMRKRQNAISREGRDIAPLPEIADPKRRAACEFDLGKYCKTYMPGIFCLPFCDDHRKVIRKLEKAILEGGQFGNAMPRESGKTAMCIASAIWACTYGHRQYVALIGANETKAGELLEDVQEILQGNPLLIADFPESVWPFTLIGNTPQKARGQLFNGELTDISIKEGRIQFPNIPGSKAAGARLVVTGLTGGGVRGLHKIATDLDLEEQTWDRPDFVILDDPQTDASARSREQNRVIVKLISGAVLGMGGASGKRIACVMPCTVIEAGDAVDQMLELPKWKAERCKRVYSFPKNTKLWDEYAKLRQEDFLAEKAGQDNPRSATKFYLANREAMDEGCAVAWLEQFNDDEASAIQHAMNLMIDEPETFWAEHQNEPRKRDEGENSQELKPEEITRKLTNLPERVVPNEATRLTAFIDVQENILVYAVCAWDEYFSGSVISYGHWPRQHRSYFRRADASPSFTDAYPGIAHESAIYKALEDLTATILGEPYRRDQTGQQMYVDRCMIDTGHKQNIVLQFIQKSPYKAQLMPSKGYGIGPAKIPMSEWPKRDRELKGLNWVLRQTEKGKAVRFETNFWKSFVAARWLTPFGSWGCLSLFGSRAADHKMFADHCTSEKASLQTGPYGRINVWTLKPTCENDWWDCIVGASVAASTLGVEFATSGVPSTGPEPRPKLRYADKIAQRERESVTGMPAAQSVPSSSSSTVANEANGQQQMPAAPATAAPKKKLRYADVMREREQRKRSGG